MDKLVQDLLNAAKVVVGNLMKHYHDSRAVPDDLVGLCLAITKVEESESINMETCRLCGKPRDPQDTMDNPKPCGCDYTDAMKARDVLERIRTDINLAAELLDGVIGRNIIR